MKSLNKKYLEMLKFLRMFKEMLHLCDILGK